MSKGSWQRPTDAEAFETNFDAVFGKKEPVYKRKQLQEDIDTSNYLYIPNDDYILEPSHDPI
jgi:hypothetical protein